MFKVIIYSLFWIIFLSKPKNIFLKKILIASLLQLLLMLDISYSANQKTME